MQFSWRTTSAGWYPFRLSFVLERASTSFGHARAHSPQPLQRSSLMVTLIITIHPSFRFYLTPENRILCSPEGITDLSSFQLFTVFCRALLNGRDPTHLFTASDRSFLYRLLTQLSQSRAI